MNMCEPLFCSQPLPAWIWASTLLFLLLLGHISIFADQQPAGSSGFPAIVYVEEMKPFPDGFTPASHPITPALPPKVLESFEHEWGQVVASISTAVHAESLRTLSRWAKAEMASFTLPADWLPPLPMEPVAHSADRHQVLFSQDVSRGFPLPSHHPLVFRRLVVAVEFDTQKSQIKRVFITIRGWREE